MTGAEAVVVVGDDGLEGLLLAFWVLPVVEEFLRQVFLNLPDVGADIRGRREDGGDVERDESRIGLLLVGLRGLEEVEILDRVVDGRGGKDGVEPAPAGGRVVLG